MSQNPSHLFPYRALYQFTARNPDELSLQTGDIVTVDESQDAEPDWLAGSKAGKAGWFPANYVEKVKDAAALNNKTSTPLAVSAPAENNTTTTAPAATAVNNAADKTETSSANNNPTPLASSQKSAFVRAPPTTTTQLPQPTLQVQPVPSQARYRALYPWIAKKDNHLSFEKDDIVTVSEMQEMWWFGDCKGKTGWFPKSYVKELQSTTPVNNINPPASPKTSPVVKRKAPQPPVAAVRKKSLAPTQPSAKEYVASFDFDGTEPGDLSFVAGDIIMVMSTDGEWWKGTLKGVTGIFPANYVSKKPAAAATTEQNKLQLPPSSTTTSSSATNDGDDKPTGGTLTKPQVAQVIADYQATSAEQLSLSVGQLVSVRKKSDRGWWEGVLQARGKKRQSGWFPANYVKLKTGGGNSRSSPLTTTTTTATTDNNQGSSSVVAADQQQQHRVTVLYDYTAQNNDELTFKQGQSIVVHDRSDADWWKGSLEDDPMKVVGLFPSNYVTQ